MTLAQEMARFDELLARVHPAAFATLRPGLDDAGIAELRAVVAPFAMSPELEALYRWHDGADGRDRGVFSGKRMLTSAEVRRDRRFRIDDLGHPPAWFTFTDGPDFLISTLRVPDADPVPGIWCADTHDVGVHRRYDSLEAMVATAADMLADERETLDRRRQIVTGDLRWGGAYRLARSPGAWVHPDPPEGTSVVLFKAGTPDAWLRSMGTSGEELLPRGATTTVAELFAASARGVVSGTIQGHTRQVAGPMRAIGFTVDDGTGGIRLVADDALTVIGPVAGTRVEVDVTVEPDGSVRLTALRRRPEWVDGTA